MDVDNGLRLAASDAASKETPPRLANASAARTLEYATSAANRESAAYITLLFAGVCKSNSVCKDGTSFG